MAFPALESEAPEDKQSPFPRTGALTVVWEMILVVWWHMTVHWGRRKLCFTRTVTPRPSLQWPLFTNHIFIFFNTSHWKRKLHSSLCESCYQNKRSKSMHQPIFMNWMNVLIGKLNKLLKISSCREKTQIGFWLFFFFLPLTLLNKTIYVLVICCRTGMPL